MAALKRHQLVRADLRAAFDWYEDQQTGLGLKFMEEFRQALRLLRRAPMLFSIRFTDVRRLNMRRFPYGVFYVVRSDEVRILAVLHASRDTGLVLVERRKGFAGI